jgi:hypothetical protein
VLLYLGVHKKSRERARCPRASISKELEEARRLREEAEKLLLDYRRKLGDVVTEVEDIVYCGGGVGVLAGLSELGFTDRMKAMILQRSSLVLMIPPKGGIGPVTTSCFTRA